MALSFVDLYGSCAGSRIRDVMAKNFGDKVAQSILDEFGNFDQQMLDDQVRTVVPSKQWNTFCLKDTMTFFSKANDHCRNKKRFHNFFVTYC